MAHKIVAVPHQQFLQYQNGRRFLYFADTWWFALSNRWTDTDFQHAVDLRKKQDFTAIHLVVGVPPEVPFWSRHAENDGGHPFLSDFSPNPKYFDHADQRIRYLIKQGIVPVLFGNWGYHIDLVGKEKMQDFWAEIITRYANLPVLYCLTGEVDLFPPIGYFHQGFTRKLLHSLKESALLRIFRHHKSQNIKHKMIKKRLNDWAAVAESIKLLDPITPLTVHPHSNHSASTLFDHPIWLDIDAIQSGHSDQANTFFIDQVQKKYVQQPFIDLESPYEGIHNQFYGNLQLQNLDIRLQYGAAGFTYGAQGLWNLNTKKDPFLTHWGTNTWQDALVSDVPNELLTHFSPS